MHIFISNIICFATFRLGITVPCNAIPQLECSLPTAALCNRLAAGGCASRDFGNCSETHGDNFDWKRPVLRRRRVERACHAPATAAGLLKSGCIHFQEISTVVCLDGPIANANLNIPPCLALLFYRKHVSQNRCHSQHQLFTPD